MPLTIFGEALIDPAAIEQIERCLTTPEDRAVLTADAHVGYGHPIGGVVAYRDKISLSGVGFDIACGNKACQTNIRAADVDVEKIMDEIFCQIGFGVGRPNPKPVDHPVLDHIAHAPFVSGIGVVAEIEAKMFSLAQKFNRGTELEFSTSAAITPIPC